MSEEGLEFEEVLKEAQQKGYAEGRPKFWYWRRWYCSKLIILTIIGFGIYVKQDKFHVEGITSITLEDIILLRKNLTAVLSFLQ